MSKTFSFFFLRRLLLFKKRFSVEVNFIIMMALRSSKLVPNTLCVKNVQFFVRCLFCFLDSLSFFIEIVIQYSFFFTHYNNSEFAIGKKNILFRCCLFMGRAFSGDGNLWIKLRELRANLKN